jgi:hypothetical protein
MPPPLGFIPPSQRSVSQHAAHASAMAGTKQFALPVPKFAKGESIRLFDFWKHPDVVADVGFVFDRIHQQTGSCVWAGGTNGVFSSIAAQRMASDSPIKAFLPFTLGNYAMSRHAYGDDGQGEGSMGSTFAKSLTEDGLRDWPNDGSDHLPKYTHQDGISVTSHDEMVWSSVRNPLLQGVLTASKPHTFGSAAECKSSQDVKAMIGNGYGVTFACNNYIGNAHVQGSGSDACVVGYWDSYGPHQQSVHAFWEHPTLGPLYWAQNNWPGNTYPSDPAGGPVCGCWVKEANLDSAMRNLEAEVFGLSHLNWFPAQPKVLDWTKAF